MRISAKKLTLMAVLTAAAVIIFIIEAQIPLPIPVPGVKLGLANAVTLFALFYGKGKPFKENPSPDSDKVCNDKPCTDKVCNDEHRADMPRNTDSLTTANAFIILLCRIFLGAVFTGRLIAFAYSFSGGLLGFAAQAVMKRFVSHKQIWVCGAIGAVFHNVGQILAAIVITGTPSIAAYLPVLIIAGVFTGVITGFIAQFTLTRMERV